MKIDAFFAELKRRNVYKVAVAYAIVAWLLIQAASIFLPAFDAPPWVMKITLAQSRKTLEIDPNFHVVRGYLGEALQFKNQLAEALPEFRAAAAATDEPYSHALLGQACARAGLRDEAQKILAQLEEQSHTKFVTGWGLAVVRLALGDKDGAIAGLETAFDQHAAEILALQYDPLFDDLHGDPRFEALVQKITGGK